MDVSSESRPEVAVRPAQANEINLPPTEKPAIPPVTKANQSFTVADLLLLICVSIWAVNVPFVKLMLNYIEPLGISLIRFGTAGVVMIFVVLWFERSLAIKWRDLPLIVGCALIGITLNQVLFVYALNNTTSSEVSLLMASTPSFATLVAWLAGQEKARMNYWLSLPIALFGVAMIVLTAQGAHLGGSWLGDILALCTACSWACYTVLIRPLMYKYSPGKISAWVTTIGAGVLLPFGLPQIHAEKIAAMPGYMWLVILYCIFASVVLTNILWYIGIKRLGGPRTAFYSYLQPFLGVVAATFIVGEQIIGWQILGGFFVIASMLIYRIQWRR